MRMPRNAVHRLVDRFEARGVYVPGEDHKPVTAWRDFGWLIAIWLLTVALFVLFFALAT